MNHLTEEIEPFYFGALEKQLFGLHHLPQFEPTRPCGVVLCPPMGHEYIQAHRALRQLAVRLSRASFHVLRFDLYGCGDSSGGYEQTDALQWLSDISFAIDEIRDKSSFPTVCLVGLRLGATLSMITASERGDIDGLVLWDPVVNGRTYVKELITLDQTTFRYLRKKWKRRTTEEKRDEILGFPLTDRIHQTLQEIDLLTIPKKPANSILLVESDPNTIEGELKTHLENVTTDLGHQHIPGPQIWIEDINKVLMPNRTIQAIVSWMSEVYS